MRCARILSAASKKSSSFSQNIQLKISSDIQTEKNKKLGILVKQRERLQEDIVQVQTDIRAVRG
jgi:hypothetical protein